MRALLHPDFVEFGASGRAWDRSSISAVTSGIEEPIVGTDLRPTRLGPDAILLTYRSDASGRRALRSSIRVRVPDGGWLLRFHQETSRTDRSAVRVAGCPEVAHQRHLRPVVDELIEDVQHERAPGVLRIRAADRPDRFGQRLLRDGVQHGRPDR